MLYTQSQSKILVILPGWGGSHETWADFVMLAKPAFKDVVVIDLPCFGDEPCPKDVWGVEEYAEFAKEKISKYANMQIVLLGHSFGGAVATQLVANNPEIVSKLILSGAAVIRPKNYLKRFVFGTIAKIGKGFIAIIPSEKLKNVAKKVLYRISDSPDFSKTSGIKRDIFKKIIRQDLHHKLASISIPTCVMQGEDDTYVPFRYGKRIAEGIPSASFVVIAKGTHGLHLKKTTDAFLSAILEFCQTSLV
ncbi:MAG: alpha/beta hydrolase fold protein [uncultured bacterium (gcode 4)]|uniref:Alpha/beta hydrolase fold protein n=1 Tax=uncultured bacterium (gcode 4) TaxID=1234023 RepID=K1XVT8_9BACT|nr:MAG: alpha/beta hydrolase fold protein [uncultured bacterium (gcode 4)]